MKKTFIYLVAALALIGLSQYLSHRLLFGWSLACDFTALASLGAFCYLMDKRQGGERQ